MTTTDQDSTAASKRLIDDFLIAHGGPFYELQLRLGLLNERAFRAVPRAAALVFLAFGVPLILTIIAGTAFGSADEQPFIRELGIWARFVFGVGLFVLSEQQVEKSLREILKQLAEAPLLAPGSMADAANAVVVALKRRDNPLAELACLVFAVGISVLVYQRFIDDGSIAWAVQAGADGVSLTLAGWWVVAFSNTLFWFLLLRFLWRIFVWARLLKDFAQLEYRLVVTHPDGHGGLAFLGEYPNAYAMVVFGMSFLPASAIVYELGGGGMTTTTYGIVLTVWLAVVLVLFVWPLLAFNKPLRDLKQKTMLASSTQATRHLRASERDVLGENVVAIADAESEKASDQPDSSKVYLAAQKLSSTLIRRAALLPVSAAALIPLIAAGATQFSLKEVLSVAKRLLLF
jgi:hypothetical protein